MRKTTGDALVGTDVAHYVVEARLGGGGMGVVYAARDTKLGRKVALKFLPPQWSHDESAKQRFMREAQAASATDHPNICTIHDIGTAADGQLFIVMAHYDGQTLKARLEGGRLPVDEAVDIAAQVAEGLAKAHSQGVVHRDIKPGNLMLTEDGVKILDFGLAKFADARLKLTLEGSTLGTIAYMSPEQARGDEADARSDIWAVGVVLYEMLTGEVPFKGGYPEAISHAIKNDPPPPIRAAVPEVPEALEQLVFRALYKERGIRIQSARELARALRLLQGRTLPLDLRTEALPQVDALRAAAAAPAGRWRSRKAAVAAAIVLVLTAGVPAWMFWPVARVPVAVAPVVNQTGYAELDAYRLALSRELIAQLSESRGIRVLPHERLLQITSQFRTNGGDISGRQAMQLLTQHSGAAAIVVPTLVNEGSGWRARVDIRNPRTATTEASWETAPVLSSLPKEAVYALMPALAQGLQEHFTSTGPWRASVAQRLRRLAGLAGAPASVTFRTLDAADAFERGQEAFEQQEYAAALAAFTTASERDPRSPLALAWRSRAARLMRRDQEALDNAEAAARLLRPDAPRRDRLLVEATAAEARGEAQIAEARYSALVEIDPGDASALGQLAGFLERQGRVTEAIAVDHRLLAADSRAIRPHLDLCRLYNPRELAAAREQGGLALQGYRTVGDRGGEAQTLFCLVDALRLGTAEERQQARAHATAALEIAERLGYPYTRARAHHYVALAAFAVGDLPVAARAWEQAAAGAHAVGNAVLEPLALMNLAAVEARLGHPSQQLELLQRSAALFETLGQHLRVAELEANVGALLIEYAGQPEEGLRRLQNALQVARKLGSTIFEVFGAQVTGAYYRFAGRHAEADRELNRALALARERDLADYISSITTELARSRLETGRYDEARSLLMQAIGDGKMAEPVMRILLAQADMRLGDTKAASEQLAAASRALDAGGDPEDLPQLHTALGQLAYESGRIPEARASFERASMSWTDDLPEAAVLEARAYLGLFDTMSGRVAGGQAAIRRSIEQAQRLGRLSLETVCRVLLARAEIAARNYSAALATLDAIPADDDTRTVGTELRAHALYWRSRALAGLGNPGAAADADRARRMIEELRQQVPDALRAGFAQRPDIRLIVEGPVFEPKGSLR